MWKLYNRQLVLKPYDRQQARAYAKRWALSRNPAYFDYEHYGGDCTNFISQCLYAGQIPFDEVGQDILLKWYWYSDKLRTPSWTAVKPFRMYLLNNNHSGTQSFGIFASLCEYQALEIGDLVQKTLNGVLTHTMIVTEKIYNAQGEVKDYLICQHTYDLKDFPLSEKDGEHSYIKIHGYYA